MNKIPSNYPPGLNAILYSLFYIKDVYDNNVYINYEKKLSKTQDRVTLEMYHEAVHWSLLNQNTDFSTRLSNMHHDNDEILFFLNKTNEILNKLLNTK